MKKPHQSKKSPPALRFSDRTRIAIKPDGTKLAVVDAKYSALIQPSEEDIRNSVPLDHTNCMYCFACRRQFSSDLVWVTRTLAYVELKNKDGVPELVRFILADPARVKIREFDSGAEVSPTAVIFKAPQGSLTLNGRLATEANRPPRTRKKAYVKGTSKVSHAGDGLRERASGMFHFNAKKHETEKSKG